MFLRARFARPGPLCGFRGNEYARFRDVERPKAFSVILVDTSVWIDHLRVANVRLAALLYDWQVCCHPLVIGELACGSLRRRDEFLSLLANLPQVAVVTDDEVMRFIEAHRLMGQGLGWIDVHLLASAAAASARLWSRDRRLLVATNLRS